MKLTKQGIERVRDILVIVGLAFGGFQLWQADRSIQLSSISVMLGPYDKARTQWIDAIGKYHALQDSQSKEEALEEISWTMDRFLGLAHTMCENVDILPDGLYNILISDMQAVRNNPSIKDHPNAKYIMNVISRCPTNFIPLDK